MSTLPNSHRRVNPSASEAAIKEAVRARDGYRCVRCGMTAVEHVKRYGKTLEVHRIDPGTTYSIERCETLCRPCHGPEPKSPPGDPSVPLPIMTLDGRIVTIHRRLSECNIEDIRQVIHYHHSREIHHIWMIRVFQRWAKKKWGVEFD